MNRDHPPCGTCSRFLAAASRPKGEEGPGYCEGFDRPAYSTDRPCVLFIERDSWTDRKARMPSEAGKRRITTQETT